MKEVVIGTIGAGFAAYLHGNGFKRVSGVPYRLKGVSDIIIEKAEEVKNEYGYEYACSDYQILLNDPEINTIDIVTPPFLHIDIAKAAIKAGKNVICEKPLTGFFGEPGQENVGFTPKKIIYDKVLNEMNEVKEELKRNPVKFLYAENYLYAPAVQKMGELIRAKKSKILFMKGEESVVGSMSPVAGKWCKTGGGSLLRIGSHPLGGMLWLKMQDAISRGETFGIKSVTCDIGQAGFCLSEEEHKYVLSHPEDVEDVGCLIITFWDGTKALVTASDLVIGGTRNSIDLYCNNNQMSCNLTPTDMLSTYFRDDDGIGDIELGEMLPYKTGWNKNFVSDDIIRGYVDEMNGFLRTIAFDEEPVGGFDIAYECTKILHAAYVAAEEGRRFDF